MFWPTKKLGEIAPFLRGAGLSKKDLTPSGKHKCILYGQLYTTYGPVINDVKSRTNKKGSVLSVAGDVLVPGTTTADEIGIAVASALNEAGVILGGDINVIRTENKILDSKFLAYLLSGPYKMRMARYARGTNIIHLSGKDIAKIEVPVPPKSTQKQIVERLDKIAEAQKLNDDLIQKSDELFQSLLHKELNPVGKDWEVKKLGDVCEFYNGKAHERIITDNGEYIVVNSKFIASDGEIMKHSNRNLVPLVAGDIAIVMSDIPNGKAMAKCFLVKQGDKFTLNQRIGLIRSNSFEKAFLYYQLNRNKYFLKFNDGQSQTNLRKSDILNCPLFIPKISEQKQIVAKLSAVQEYKTQLLAQKSKLKELFHSVLAKSMAND